MKKNEGKHVMLLHVRIGPTQIDGLIMRPSRPNFCENENKKLCTF